MKICIVLPVLNEEKVLRSTAETLYRFVAARFAGDETSIVIVDNGSDDATPSIAAELVATHPDIRVRRLDRRGKGLAIREGWRSCDADVFAFMDADLATDIEALPALVGAIAGGADVAVGSRFHANSTVERSSLRRLLSQGYRWLLRAMFATRVADVPCGFKAVSRRTVRELVPAVKDDQWFFDTELVMRAERSGARIAEVPVVWKELKPAGRRSKVRIIGLVAEYVSKVWRLRRELGAPPRPAPPYPDMRALCMSVSIREWWWVGAAAAAVIAFTTSPYFYGIAIARGHGLVWSGRSFLSPGDFSIYLSYIAQAKGGAWLFDNFATTERLTPVLNILWLGVGLVARGLSLAPPVAYHVARVLLVPLLAVTSYVSIAYFFRARALRLGAFALFMFGSGLGLFAAPLLGAPKHVDGVYQWPIDFWVSEANTFMTMLYSPHFIASLALMLATFTLFVMAVDTGRFRYAAASGATALLLFQFHPFHVPTVLAVLAAAAALRAVNDGFRFRELAMAALVPAIAAPSVVYHYWLTHWSENARFMLDNNRTPTPALWHVAIGLGAIAPLAVIGWHIEREAPRYLRPWHRSFLAAWTLLQLALVYSPLIFQRRLIEGIEFPLVMLAVPALAYVAAVVTRMPKLGRTYVHTYGVLLAAAIFLPSTVSSVYRTFELYDVPKPGVAYFAPDEAAVHAWLRGSTAKDAVVLSGPGLGDGIIGWGERRVYAGHWANTIDLKRKAATIERFFGPATHEDRLAILSETGASIVIEGPDERSFGGDLAAEPALAPAFRSGKFVVYTVISGGGACAPGSVACREAVGL